MKFAYVTELLGCQRMIVNLVHLKPKVINFSNTIGRPLAKSFCKRKFPRASHLWERPPSTLLWKMAFKISKVGLYDPPFFILTNKKIIKKKFQYIAPLFLSFIPNLLYYYYCLFYCYFDLLIFSWVKNIHTLPVSMGLSPYNSVIKYLFVLPGILNISFQYLFCFSIRSCS